jgi:PTH1 family peptidyl-tRNA hydrolase
VLNDFAKSERPWVEALCDVMADNAELLAKGQDASFQNKVHLALSAKGFFGDKEPKETPAGSKAPKENPRES